MQKINFFLLNCSIKEAKKKCQLAGDFFVVDIGKIIKELGYEISDLTEESEFVINYSIQKKITQGIYSNKYNGILVVHRNISEDFVKNLEHFLEDLSEEITYTIKSI